MTYRNNLALLPPLSGESLVHSFAQGHRFARISASINLQPLRLGLDKDREVLLLMGGGCYLHLTDDPI